MASAFSTPPLFLEVRTLTELQQVHNLKPRPESIRLAVFDQFRIDFSEYNNFVHDQLKELDFTGATFYSMDALTSVELDQYNRLQKRIQNRSSFKSLHSNAFNKFQSGEDHLNIKKLQNIMFERTAIRVAKRVCVLPSLSVLSINWSSHIAVALLSSKLFLSDQMTMNLTSLNIWMLALTTKEVPLFCKSVRYLVKFGALKNLKLGDIMTDIPEKADRNQVRYNYSRSIRRQRLKKLFSETDFSHLNTLNLQIQLLNTPEIMLLSRSLRHASKNPDPKLAQFLVRLEDLSSGVASATKSLLSTLEKMPEIRKLTLSNLQNPRVFDKPTADHVDRIFKSMAVDFQYS